jgi:hypothetical protein
MKKLAFSLVVLMLAAGCMYYGPRDRFRPYQERRVYGDKHGHKQDSREFITLTRTHTEPPPPRYAEPGYKELFFSVDADIAFASDVLSFMAGVQHPDANWDFGVGMGFGFQMTTFVRSRIFLREREDTPYIFVGYWRALESPEITFEDDWDETTYIFKAAGILGFGFGYQWRVDEGAYVHAQLGYHNRVNGGHLSYVSGSDPEDAPDLFDEAQSWVAGNSITAGFGVEFRF